MSPIPLLTQSQAQGLRMNGLATIELSSPGKCFVNIRLFFFSLQFTNIYKFNFIVTQHQQQSQQQQRIHTSSAQASGAQLHKLLMGGASGGVGGGCINHQTTPIVTTSSGELSRLPGGAELNILPASTNGLYRNQKVAIVNNGLTLKGECFVYYSHRVL